MAQEPSLEQRILLLEQGLAALRAEVARKEQHQTDLDLALLRRVDALLEDVRILARDQRSSFDALKFELIDLRTRLVAGQTETQTALQQMSGILSTHKGAIEGLAEQVRGLATGQQQILDILIGGKRNIHD